MRSVEHSNLIEALKRYRLKHQLTQQQLAKKLGVGYVTLNRWLNGHVKPQELQRYRIEQLLKRDRRNR